MYLTFEELIYGLDVLGDWFMALNNGNMHSGGEASFRLLILDLFGLDEKILQELVKGSLHEYSSINVSRVGKKLSLKNVQPVEQHSQHHQIFNTIKKFTDQLENKTFFMQFYILDKRNLLPPDGTSYSLSLRGKIKNEGIEIESIHQNGFKIDDVVSSFKEISQIRKNIKNIYCKEEESLAKDKEGKIKPSPEVKDLVQYELQDEVLAKASVDFFKKYGGYRRWKLGENKTSIVTDAYSYEIASVLSFVKLVQIPQNWEFKKDEKNGG